MYPTVRTENFKNKFDPYKGAGRYPRVHRGLRVQDDPTPLLLAHMQPQTDFFSFDSSAVPHKFIRGTINN